MKRMIAVLLAAVLCLGLTACADGNTDAAQEMEDGFSGPVVTVDTLPVSQTDLEELPDPEPVWKGAEGVTFSLLQDAYPVGTTKLTLGIDNQSDSEIGWGTYEAYEKYVDGAWQPVEFIGGMDAYFRDVQWVREPRSTGVWTLRLLSEYAPLDEGLYRVTGSNVWFDGEKGPAWQVSFRITAEAQPEPDYALYISSQPVPIVEGCMVMDRLPVYFINRTGEDYSVLLIPRLEKQEESGAWTEVPFRDGIGFCGVSDPLPAGITKGSEPTAMLWGSLGDGRYRLSYALGPDAAMDPEAERISGEFTLYMPENNAGLPLAPQD